MLISISLISLYPRFFRWNPSCCKAIFTWNDKTGTLPDYQPKHSSFEIYFHEFKLHLYLKCFFSSPEANLISYTLSLSDYFPRASTSACSEQTDSVMAQMSFPK